MKHIVFDSKDKKGIANAIKEVDKSFYSSQLLQIYTSTTDEIKLSKIIKKYHKKFPDAIIIGTTTAGEIAHAKMYENSTIISLSLFKQTTLKAKHIKNIDVASGKKLSTLICSINTKATIILSEGLNGKDYEGFIKGFKEKYPSNIIAGGLAGDNFKLKKTLIFLNSSIYTEGSVAVSFSGTDLFADNKYNLNWEPIGKEFTITSSDGYKVKEIDNQSAVSIFKKYLGEDIFLNDAKDIVDFQLLYRDGQTTVSRTPMAVDGSSLIFAAPLKEGQKVKFGFSNASSIISGSKAISTEIEKNPAQAIYVFSCIARKTLLGYKLEDEFKNFESTAPTAGFFTYGEYYSTSQNNALLNCTTTLLILSESDGKKRNKKKKPYAKEMDDVTFSALKHFIKQTSNELNSNISLLNQYRNIVDSSLIVSKTDTKGIITYVNDYFCKVCKYSADELLGKPHSIVRHKDVPKSAFKKMWDTIQDDKIWRGTIPNRAKDGSTYYVNATIMPTHDAITNEIDGYIAIRQNITKQIVAKNRVQEKEKLIKAVFDNQNSIVILSSKEEGMISANKTLYKYFHYENFEEFKADNDCICDLFIEEDGYVSAQTDKLWLDHIADNIDNKTDYKAKILTKDKKVHTFSIKVNMINNQYIINLQDITNLEIALKKAYSSQRAKSIFLANMSHEIRTPLNGIIGFTDILRKKELDLESARYVNIVHKSSQSLLTVVNDILDFSKIESGELTINSTDSNIFQEMEVAVSTFASVSKSKHIDYYTYIDTNLPKILLCDAQRLKQVINNLISNAIKFTPKGGKVKVHVEVKKIKNKKAIVLFSVKDSGIGIKKNKISTIFKAFSQADDSISRKFGGTGLGLSISSQYIKMMGSKIKVKSTKNKGSEFYFKLKLPVVNSSHNIESHISDMNKKISILQPVGKIECGIYEIVKSYLKGWDIPFLTIDMKDIDEEIDLLIICAKNFHKNSCERTLLFYENINLIYIEGAEENLNISHSRFHLLEQPMTGSLLFDKMITLVNPLPTTSEVKIIDTISKKYNGKVLVAEDNETNQILVSIMLDEREIVYTIVENGQEALDEALKNHYDLILMDINMPVLDGMNATKRLRANNYTKAIVSLSANVIESDKKRFLEAGMDDTLNKPIDLDKLDEILSKYLSVKGSSDIDFDDIDIDVISAAILRKGQDKKVVLQLLQSFSKSALTFIKKIEEDSLDKEILHKIKGLSGNLRFKKLYELVLSYESEFSSWDDETDAKNAKIVVLHLENAINNIKKL